MLIFSEKMRNIPEVVLCLKHALAGEALYGLVWNPRSVFTRARVYVHVCARLLGFTVASPKGSLGMRLSRGRD